MNVPITLERSISVPTSDPQAGPYRHMTQPSAVNHSVRRQTRSEPAQQQPLSEQMLPMLLPRPSHRRDIARRPATVAPQPPTIRRIQRPVHEVTDLRDPPQRGVFQSEDGVIRLLEGWLLRRAEAGDDLHGLSWLRVIRTSLPITFEEMSNVVRIYQEERRRLWEEFSTLSAYQQQQIERLLAEKKQSESDARYEWVVAALQTDPVGAYKFDVVSLQIVVQRRLRVGALGTLDSYQGPPGPPSRRGGRSGPSSKPDDDRPDGGHESSPDFTRGTDTDIYPVAEKLRQPYLAHPARDNVVPAAERRAAFRGPQRRLPWGAGPVQPDVGDTQSWATRVPRSRLTRETLEQYPVSWQIDMVSFYR